MNFFFSIFCIFFLYVYFKQYDLSAKNVSKNLLYTIKELHALLLK